ncbi:MAG: AAA family ATPase [Candidatus Omnitrophica bacterium]|nr:AAA family ATPase [Candidatus Omnitrophota bacterium]
MEDTRNHVYVTGKAGTGKSTLLKYFKEHTKKKVIVLAPTGVAAVNISGQTIHSFFGFPPKYIDPRGVHRSRNKNLIEKLDAVIIDEVSMVRADLMDGIDYALRINRDEMGEAFGGVQMIFFGDLFQLSPVVDRDSRDILAGKYENPYFFSSDIFKNLPMKHFELKKIYRQSDANFVGMLNRFRNNDYTEDDISFLNERVDRNGADKGDGTIVLTATNSAANEINHKRLSGLFSKKYEYKAVVTGEFDEKSYPTEALLGLKEGAQVMLIRNDPGKRWVNGTIAEVRDLADNRIEICIEGVKHEVSPVSWKKIRYTYNKATDRVEEEEIGTFTQYPIKLAWAITIHKSQGQTFDKVVIELGRGAFAHGQVYVALSRCTKLEGITLKRPVIPSDIIFDEDIYSFIHSFER